jgi:hypothetical protein
MMRQLLINNLYQAQSQDVRDCAADVTRYEEMYGPLWDFSTMTDEQLVEAAHYYFGD